MILNKINKTALIDLLEIKELKKVSQFKIGEILKGNVLEKSENFLLIDLGKKGIVKAFSELPLLNEEIFLKVIGTKPKVVLKLLKDQHINIFKSLENLQLEHVEEALKNNKNLHEKVLIGSNDFNNKKILAKKLANLPEQLGFTLEKELLNGKINKESLKYKLLTENDSIPVKSHEKLTEFLTSFQKMNNQYQFIIPLIFQNNVELEKGWIAFKKKDSQKNQKGTFSIVIYLELSNNRKLQVNLISLRKNLNLSIISNNEEFLNDLKDNSESLINELKSKDYNVVSINFKYLENDDDFFYLNKELFEEDNNFNIVDIKT
jgi:hypothetical protein